LDIPSSSGQSIASLADQHGVGRDSLVSLLQAKIQQAHQSSGHPPLDQETLDEMVNRAFDRGGGETDAGAAGAGRDDSAPATEVLATNSPVTDPPTAEAPATLAPATLAPPTLAPAIYTSDARPASERTLSAGSISLLA
jgi:hypothetical protein